MRPLDLHYQIALTLLKGVGPVKAKAILDVFPNLEDFFTLDIKTIEQEQGIQASFLQDMNRESALEKSKPLVDEICARNIEPILINNPSYPRRLRHLPDAPTILYKKGTLPLNYNRVVAIVGTRNSTPYGQQLCDELITSFKNLGVLVVSGLALGIDAAAHRSCIKNDVATAAVLGHGLDRVYPAVHRELADHILRDGAIVTDFPTGTIPDRENFPKRNRLVAGMADATVVVESNSKGGSLITAYLAADYHRDVFAFPGDINRKSSRGCNRLIYENRAYLLQSPDEFLRHMGWYEKKSVSVQRQTFPNLNESQQKILNFIANKAGVHVDVISSATQLPITKLNLELFDMEMNGVIKSLPGNIFQRIE